MERCYILSNINIIKEKIEGFRDAKFEDDKDRYGITIGIHSPARTGKTLTAVTLSVWWLLDNPFIKGIISNVGLNLKPLNLQDKVKPLSDIKKISGDEYLDYIILTDEFRSIIDSRMSSSFRNMFVSNILRDTGKSRQIHILTDQEGSSIDKRVRRNTDLVLVPRVDRKKDVCIVKMFDSYEQYFLVDAYREINEWKIQFQFKISDWGIYYDTFQKIPVTLITWEPPEYGERFISWTEKTGYDNHPDFFVKTATLNLWKEETGEYISDSQKTALMEWLRYNTDLPMSGRTKG